MSCTSNNLNFINEFKLRLRNEGYPYHILQRTIINCGGQMTSSILPVVNIVCFQCPIKLLLPVACS